MYFVFVEGPNNFSGCTCPTKTIEKAKKDMSVQIANVLGDYIAHARLNGGQKLRARHLTDRSTLITVPDGSIYAFSICEIPKIKKKTVR